MKYIINKYLSIIIIKIIHEEWFIDEYVIIFFILFSWILKITEMIDEKIAVKIIILINLKLIWLKYKLININGKIFCVVDIK